jgi:hypothetical protein
MAAMIVWLIFISLKSLLKPRSGFEPEWYCSAGNCVAAPPPWRYRVFLIGQLGITDFINKLYASWLI